MEEMEINIDINRIKEAMEVGKTKKTNPLQLVERILSAVGVQFEIMLSEVGYIRITLPDGTTLEETWVGL